MQTVKGASEFRNKNQQTIIEFFVRNFLIKTIKSSDKISSFSNLHYSREICMRKYSLSYKIGKSWKLLETLKFNFNIFLSIFYFCLAIITISYIFPSFQHYFILQGYWSLWEWRIKGFPCKFLCRDIYSPLHSTAIY